MSSRILLLLEARDNKVCTTPYKQNKKVWRESTTILQTYPNYERVFETLNWRKCVDEYKRNIDLYEKDRVGISFRSGSAEQHQQWHDLMEEIFELKGDSIKIFDDVPAKDPIIDVKQTEKDLKAAGEFLRGDELENFRTKRSAKRSTTPASKKARAKSPVDEHSSDYDSAAEGTKPKELSPQDQLALALTAKLQADLENSKPRAPVLAQKMYRISMCSIWTMLGLELLSL